MKTAQAHNDASPPQLASALTLLPVSASAPVTDFRTGSRGAERRLSCDGCGEFGWFRRNGPFLCPGCLDRQLAEVAVKQRMAPIAAPLASIPEAFRDLRFEFPELAKRVHSDVGRQLAARLAPLDKPYFVLLVGGTGEGKTSLAVAMLAWHLEKGIKEGATAAEQDWARRSLFVTARQVALARRQSPLGAEPELLLRARAASVLLLDDLGQEAPSDKDDVVALICDRHAEQRPTLITYGFGLDELAPRYGAHVERRLLDRTGRIDLGSPGPGHAR